MLLGKKMVDSPEPTRFRVKALLFPADTERCAIAFKETKKQLYAFNHSAEVPGAVWPAEKDMES